MGKKRKGMSPHLSVLPASRYRHGTNGIPADPFRPDDARDRFPTSSLLPPTSFNACRRDPDGFSLTDGLASRCPLRTYGTGAGNRGGKSQIGNPRNIQATISLKEAKDFSADAIFSFASFLSFCKFDSNLFVCARCVSKPLIVGGKFFPKSDVRHELQRRAPIACVGPATILFTLLKRTTITTVPL